MGSRRKEVHLFNTIYLDIEKLLSPYKAERPLSQFVGRFNL